MGFEDAHQYWLNSHLRRRTGERRSRLQRGHGHGERLFLKRVWWPLFGNFEHLHPEYEIVDWRGRPYFIDFVWSCGSFRFALEIKGYGPHVQNTDRIRYRRELNREIYLQSLGYRIVSIPYDELEENADVTIFLLRSLFAPYLSAQAESEHTFMEREVMRLAMRQTKSIRPIDLVREFEINKRTAVKVLQQLCDKGKLRPLVSGESGRVTRYERVQSLADDTVW
ncbi:hypothetical protein [Marinicrinis lubricantis]|uniref:DUF559 domain-containing protein n=1 Tax=Marinicrinis lubricantis TaxID=2086470 RepID=A0ABW1IKN4_9BACL